MSAREGAAPSGTYDVAILGGGLAGLTLALQIKRARPDTRVLVAERRAKPAPEATFKVGESTSEAGAHYFRHVLGLADHLDAEQLRKFGLRFFFTAGDNSDIARRVEYATPRRPDLYTFQIDRGRFENDLWARCLAAGVDAAPGRKAEAFEVGEDAHTLTLATDDGSETVSARWVVDATGRSSFLKRQLGLEQPTDHVVNSSWFRLAGGIDIEQWTDDAEWLGRMEESGMRRHSTCHLAGEGYWIWLINLASGPISIGVCADPRFHPFGEINELDRLFEWLGRHEPQLAAAVEDRRDEVLDFLVVEDFSYGCERVYSEDRWCLTGEAGAFLDPLYSPGSDFIGYGNTFITDMVVRDLEGEDLGNRVEFFNFFYFQLFTPALALYRDQYQFFGNPQVMLAKLLYDNTAYFSTLAYLFLHDNMARLEILFAIGDDVQRAIPLLQRMQGFFREWHALDRREWQGVSVLTQSFQAMRERQADLVAELDDEAFVARFKENIEVLYALAVVLFHRAAKLLPDPPGEDVPINPLGVSLDPERWEEDGLFSEPGITLAEARATVPGVEEFFLDERGAALAAG